MDKSKLSAIRVPRIENYNGFIFGSWDETIPPLEEYLGNAKYYLDGYIDRYEGGMEAIAVHKWVLPANWKFNVEQPTSDMQHSEISHVSAVEALASGSDTFNRKKAGRRFLRGVNSSARTATAAHSLANVAMKSPTPPRRWWIGNTRSAAALNGGSASSAKSVDT